MKLTRSPLILALAATIATLAGLMVGGCAGKAARQNVTLPAAMLSVDAGMISNFIQLGVADAVTAGDITQEEADGFLDQLAALEAAFESDDRTLIAEAGSPMIWAAFPDFARRGVDLQVASGRWGEPFDDPDDADEIPEQAETFYEEIMNFSEALVVLGQKLPDQNE